MPTGAARAYLARGTDHLIFRKIEPGRTERWVRSVHKRGFLSPSDSLGGLGKAAEDWRSVNFARSDPAPGRHARLHARGPQLEGVTAKHLLKEVTVVDGKLHMTLGP